MASPLVDVYIKLPSGRTSTLNLLPSDRVSKILDHLASEEKVPATRVRLKYQGKVLDKTKTIGYLGVCAETILKGEIIVPKDMTVYAKFSDGRCMPVKIQNVDTLYTLKTSIAEIGEMPVDTQSLKVSGTELKGDSNALFEMGINNESTLEVSVKAKAKEISPNNIVEEEPSEDLKGAMLSSFQTNGRNVEVVFSFDTTGSMSSYLKKVRQKLKETCERLLRDIQTIRIGLLAHGDYCDYNNYVTKYIDLTSDVDQLVTFAKDVSTTGGGDTPECYEWVLKKAQQLDWSEDSAKALVVIGDCEPHPPSYTDQNINWHTELDVLKGMGVKVYGVHCGTESIASQFYMELAEQTDGCYLNLKHFNLITDMFLGVCYKEADPEQLDAFTEELKQEGRLTEETKAIMEKLEESKEVKEKKIKKAPKRYLNLSWWDFRKDKGTPQYTYSQNTDTWKPIVRYSDMNHDVKTDIKFAISTEPSTSKKKSSHSDREKKKGCTLM